MKVTDHEPGTTAKCELCDEVVKLNGQEILHDDYIITARELGYWEVDILCESCEKEAQDFLQIFNEEEWVIFLNEDTNDED